jgi:hypothetical protein
MLINVNSNALNIFLNTGMPGPKGDRGDGG